MLSGERVIELLYPTGYTEGKVSYSKKLAPVWKRTRPGRPNPLPHKELREITPPPYLEG